MAQPDLTWALSQFKATRHRDAEKARDYYFGKQPLAFAVERFNTVFASKFLPGITDNLCAAVIDSLADRLELTGVSSSARTRRKQPDDQGREIVVVNDAPAARALEIWKRNSMDLRSSEVHREALLTGDGYVIVWPVPEGNVDEGRAAIWVRSSTEMAVRYSEQVPGLIEFAARRWRDQQMRWRVDLFYPDRIERYADQGEPRTWVERTLETLGLRDVGALRQQPEVENPFGRVPVFHFPNKQLYGNGIGELDDVMPLQDSLNKSVCDLFVAMEYSAFPQRWATGLDIEVDEETEKPKEVPFTPGVERVWSWPEQEARFGQFEATDLRQFLEVQESLRAEIARVSGIPLHYLYIAKGDYPSGEAMKSAEARFSKKIKDRQASFGNVWEDALEFALQIEEFEAEDAFELEAHWVSPAPRSEEEHTRTLTLKKSLGVPRSQILRELGYSEEAIAEMLEEGPDDTAGGDDEPPPPPTPSV